MRPIRPVEKIFLFHRVNGGPWWCWYYNTGMQNYPVVGYAPAFVSDAPDAYGNTTTPTTASPSQRSVTVSSIATGPASVTARKLYRTKANLTPLLLATTIANNTATTYTDTAADATLGAAAPVGDTSGIQVTAGTVNAGDTSLIVASTGPFAPPAAGRSPANKRSATAGRDRPPGRDSADGPRRAGRRRFNTTRRSAPRRCSSASRPAARGRSIVRSVPATRSMPSSRSTTTPAGAAGRGSQCRHRHPRGIDPGSPAVDHRSPRARPGDAAGATADR